VSAASTRARDLGIVIGEGLPGPLNAITDVRGLRVGHTTIVSGGGPLTVGKGPVRTGVTVIVPHDGDVWAEPLFAGAATMNGNGELTGLEWIRESGLLTGAIGITNTNDVGKVRDALVSSATASHDPGASYWALPVAGETYDGQLNDIAGGHVRAEHVASALQAANGGSVAEGGVGGGTGMICHELKGGIGTASRRLEAERGAYMVGALVQANYGLRGQLRIAGVPVGRELPDAPLSWQPAGAHVERGSIIVVIATDAPLLSHQLERVARRASLGIGRTGGIGGNGSGDIMLAFSTANAGAASALALTRVETLANGRLDPIFSATIEATEEAIVNAMVAAETMTGVDGNVVHALPHDRLREALRKYNRLVG
jgi:D-aminopeptidase